jgi:hypothetical protein
MIKVVLAGIAAATAVVGGVMAAKSYRQAAETEGQVGVFNEQLAARDADIKEQEARQIGQLRSLDAINAQNEFDQVDSSTRLAQMHHGWMPETGTPMLIQYHNKLRFDEQQADNDLRFRTAADAKREEGVQARMRSQLELAMGQQRRSALYSQATASLLGGVSGAARAYV